MSPSAVSPEAYIEALPDDRKEPVQQLRATILRNLPLGFEERMTYGMIGYVVPHHLYPAGYHCDPKLPLGFMNIASQKNCVVLHHLGIYADPELLKWFTDEYAKQVTSKLDMGKGCIRFKKMNQIPFHLIGELAAKMTPQIWIDKYESVFKR